MSFRQKAKFIDFPSIALIILAIAIPAVVALTV
jgi:hypothetical protein